MDGPGADDDVHTICGIMQLLCALLTFVRLEFGLGKNAKDELIWMAFAWTTWRKKKQQVGGGRAAECLKQVLTHQAGI